MKSNVVRIVKQDKETKPGESKASAALAHKPPPPAPPAASKWLGRERWAMILRATVLPFFTFAIVIGIWLFIHDYVVKEIPAPMTVWHKAVEIFAHPFYDKGPNDMGIAWQVLAYLLLTAAEVMVSITCLEFSYLQAPKTMKSFIMAFFMISIAAGNLFTSAVNFFIRNNDGTSKLEGANYFLFFTLAMLGTAVLFVLVARTYRGATYLHDETPETPEVPAIGSALAMGTDK